LMCTPPPPLSLVADSLVYDLLFFNASSPPSTPRSLHQLPLRGYVSLTTHPVFFSVFFFLFPDVGFCLVVFFIFGLHLHCLGLFQPPFFLQTYPPPRTDSLISLVFLFSLVFGFHLSSHSAIAPPSVASILFFLIQFLGGGGVDVSSSGERTLPLTRRLNPTCVPPVRGRVL